MEALLAVSGLFLYQQYREITQKSTPEEVGAASEEESAPRARNTAKESSALGPAVYQRLNPAAVRRRNPDTEYQETQPHPHPARPHALMEPKSSAGLVAPMAVTEYQTPNPVVRGYQPAWLRAASDGAGTTQRRERERELSAQNTPSTGQWGQQVGWDARVRQAVDPRSAFVAHAPVEQERVRPPGMGGYDGYTADRGRMPIPRYNRYDFGDDLTVAARDAAGPSGRAFGAAQRSVATRAEGWEVMPDRTIQHSTNPTPPRFLPAGGGVRAGGRVAPLGAPLQSAACDPFTGGCGRDSLTWDVGATGGIAAVRRGIVAPEQDPTSVRHADGSVYEMYDAQVGAGAHADIGRPNLRNTEVDGRTIAPVDMATKAVRAGRGTELAKGSGAKAATASQWQFSFPLKSLLGPNTGIKRTRDPAPPATHERDVVLPPVVERRPAMVAPADPKRIVDPEKRVLFSEEERADYKLDPVALDLHRHDLSDRSRVVAEGTGQFKGASNLQVTSVQFEKARTFEPGTLVNSRLKNLTADAPVKQLPQRRPQTEFQGDGGFVKRETSMAPPRLRPTDLPEKSEGVGRDATHVFPKEEHTPEETLGIRVDVGEGTATASALLENAGRYSGASRPVQSVDGQLSFSRASDAGLDLGQDELLDSAGKLQQPFQARPPPAPAARIDQSGTMRETGEFRRR